LVKNDINKDYIIEHKSGKDKKNPSNNFIENKFLVMNGLEKTGYGCYIDAKSLTSEELNLI
jgi:hypothetical protein